MIWEYIRRAWRLEDHVERSPRNQFRWCNKEGRKQRCVTCTESHEENLNGALHVNETRLSFSLVFWERGWLETRAGLKSSSKPLTVLGCTIVFLISVSWTHSCLPMERHFPLYFLQNISAPQRPGYMSTFPWHPHWSVAFKSWQSRANHPTVQW